MQKHEYEDDGTMMQEDDDSEEHSSEERMKEEENEEKSEIHNMILGQEDDHYEQEHDDHDDDRFMDEAEMNRLIREYHKNKKHPLEHQQPQDENELSEFNLIHSINTQNLIEQITRNKIFNSVYYKEECFGLNAASLIDKAIGLDSIGGTYGGHRKPSNFLCLLMKMLQIEVDMESAISYIQNEEFKYLTALAALYIRLVGSSMDIYRYLEPLFADFRKLKMRNIDGSCKIIHMDEYVEILLNEDSFCDVKLPFLVKRSVLERNGKLGPYVSPLESNEDLKALLEQKIGTTSTVQNEGEPTTNAPSQRTDSSAANKEKKSGAFKLKLKKPSKDGKSETISSNSPTSARPEEVLSIEATNELRKSLGLPLLK
ncbi:hypothetical protein FDP41_005973 [Naegleria fowleri]|uniref:Pre-mRNA-splicing factor 38 n=1 Tax=Naegleria fowleri TaxID=5763 RepID=A0A6A5BMK2_NAEFO|nr:uncharacterized protein FDP41_005973 [Naegleria fowleri]KAF0975220.1 hypothetical protein FDP41_005973 [Naegleria fowleri]CAG4717744.1 unnamed protein product [Naegleria fowleri]